MSAETLQLLRLLCLGALLAVCANGLRVLWIRRDDAALRLLVAWSGKASTMRCRPTKSSLRASSMRGRVTRSVRRV